MKVLLAGCGLRLLLVTGSIVLLAVVTLLILHQSPIYWWMSSSATPSLKFKGSYSPAGTVLPLLQHFTEVRPWEALKDGRCNVLLSQHSHTTHSDGSLTARQALDWHKAHGYTAVAITDHNSFAGGLEAARLERAQDDPVVLVGMEWTHCRGHYNFLLPQKGAEALAWDPASFSWRAPAGANATVLVQARRAAFLSSLEPGEDDDDLVLPLRKYPTDAEMRQAFATVHALGGIVVANHLPWNAWSLERKVLPSREELLRWHADYVELAHEATLDAQSLRLVQQGKWGAIAGTDLHFPQQHAYGWTCLNASDPMSEVSVLEALKRPGAVDVLFNAEGTPELLPAEKKSDAVEEMPSVGHFFAPLRWAGQFFQSFLGTSAGSEYSFVDGFCGEPRTHWLRWGIIFAAVFWACLFFAAYHLLFWAWAWLRGKSLEDVL